MAGMVSITSSRDEAAKQPHVVLIFMDDIRQADLDEIQGERTDIKVIKVEGKLPKEEGYIFNE